MKPGSLILWASQLHKKDISTNDILTLNNLASAVLSRVAKPCRLPTLYYYQEFLEKTRIYAKPKPEKWLYKAPRIFMLCHTNKIAASCLLPHCHMDRREVSSRLRAQNENFSASRNNKHTLQDIHNQFYNPLSHSCENYTISIYITQHFERILIMKRRAQTEHLRRYIHMRTDTCLFLLSTKRNS